ncbi:hypothetical protein ACFXDI_36265 [Streptomyces mirabilis]|uniref:hypothetical protein n=1 Tax=Streptomyces mirabilis TaxID=68239 RepID=UPI003682715B
MKNRDFLSWAALAAAFACTASAEYTLARACGFTEYVAFAVPAALDIYALRALRMHRDVVAAVIALIAVNAASHLVSAGLLPVGWPLVVAISAIAPLVLYRVHALRAAVAASEPLAGPPADGNPGGSDSAPQMAAQSREDAPDPVAVADSFWSEFLATAPDASADTDPLLKTAQEFDADTRKRTGKAASLRALQSEFRIGQQRAQRIRAQLAGSVCAPA